MYVKVYVQEQIKVYSWKTCGWQGIESLLQTSGEYVSNWSYFEKLFVKYPGLYISVEKGEILMKKTLSFIEKTKNIESWF